MAYLALYRQYRPKNFSEVVGQQHIVKTLSNAILTGKVGHAYLFCGPRGTGKTSIARVLAKSLNCVDGPTVTPCGKCPSCVAIDQGSSIDVREIDAASNGLVEDVRNLRETIHYAAESRYKVYIIDEVHSMKDMAFNALLKTLEEPPANVVFVLATTEAHKVPMTILSRCQRFDFRRIAQSEIVGHLKSIVAKNGVQITEDAVALVANRAQGGMRDALSLLDQCLAFGEAEVTRSDVLTVLGSVADQSLEELLQAVTNGEPLRVVSLLDQVEGEGKDLGQLIRDLIDFLRNLLTDGVRSDLVIKQDQLMGFLNILAACESEMRWSSQPRLNLELALFRMSEDYRFGDRIRALEARLDRLESGQASVMNPEHPTPGPRKGDDDPPFESDGPPQAKPSKATVAKKPVKAPPDTSKEDGVFAATPEPVQDDQLEAVKVKWNEVMEWVKKEKISAHAILLHARLRSLSGDLLELNFNEEFHRRTIERADNKQVVERGLLAILGQAYRIRCTKGQETIAPPPKTTALVVSKPAAAAEEDDDLLIAGAIKLFGKDKVEIKN